MVFLKVCNIKGHPYGYLVKGIRDKKTGKVKHEIIKYYGRMRRGSVGKTQESEIKKAIKLAQNKLK